MDTQLRFINRSHDGCNSEIVLFQKNVATNMDEFDKKTGRIQAWCHRERSWVTFLRWGAFAFHDAADVESTADHTYVAGGMYSLADVAVLPYVVRLDHLRLSQMWSNLPNVQRWYDRVREWPAVQQAVFRCMTETDRALFTECDVYPWSKVSKIVEAVR
jgi:hypothetical protein